MQEVLTLKIGAMNNFDDKLRDNIKKAFDNYNSDHLTDEGWDSFVAMQKGRRRRAVIFPLWVRAASVLLLIGLGAVVAYRLSVRQPNLELISTVESAAGSNEDRLVQESAPPTHTPLPESVSEPSVTDGRTAAKDQDILPSTAYGETLLKTAQTGSEGKMIRETPESRSHYPGISPVPVPAIALNKLYYNAVSDEIRPEYSIPSIIPADGSETLEPLTDTEKSSGGRSILAGMSGLMAQAGEKSSPASGMSMGFYLSQKITRRLSVRPGLALAMQSFGLKNGGQMDKMSYNIPLHDGTNAIPHSYEGRLSMVALEVPLNLVVTLFERKGSGFFVSAGTSSLFYISQQLKANVVNKYTMNELGASADSHYSATMFSTVVVEKEYDSFSSADFFGLANISAGYSFPYSKTGIMLVEPFVQLPVNDLTSMDLRIRYAGISMKLQFGNNK